MSSGKYRKEHNCLNCGHHVEEHYCSRCGQPNLELKENVWHFVTHSVAHYFHFDNKFFKTLIPLLTKPGQVTLDYLAGKRARYINPVNMYIFVSIVYFLVVSTPKKHEKSKEEEKQEQVVAEKTAKATANEVTDALKDAGIKNQALIDKTNKAIQEDIAKDSFTKSSFKRQDSILKALQAQNKASQSDSLNKIIKKLTAIHEVRNDSTYDAYLARQKTLPLLQRDNWFERFVKKRSIGMGENSELINEQLEHNRPKQYFLFMPLMALFIMINFRKNHIYYMDHLIFTIHGMTAFFLVSIVTQTLSKHIFGSESIISSFISLAMLVWILWYMYKALKIFYQRKRSTTIWRMVWIFVLYGFAFKVTEMIIINIIFYVAV